MEFQILTVFIILAVTILLFVTELFPIDKISFFIIVALILCGLTTPQEAISGFANPATITVLSLMILAIGLEENGVIQWLTDVIKKLKILPLLLITPAFMVISAGISAFISTTAVVIIFIKIVSQLAEKYNFSAAKLLMPISFAGILGGSCTLMGTSTNLLVNQIALDLGADKFSFFEFSAIGIILLAIGVVYMMIASRWLPKDKAADFEHEYAVEEYVFTVSVDKDSELIGERLEDIEFLNSNGTSIIKLIRGQHTINAPGRYINLKEGDNLVLMSDIDNLGDIKKIEGFKFHDNKTIEIEEESDNKKSEKEFTLRYVELLVLPGSKLLGKTMKNLRNMSLEGAFPIAIKKRKNLRNTKERLIRKNIQEINIKPGDRILLELQEKNISQLYNIENTAILNQHDSTPTIPTSKKLITSLILLGVIAIAASGLTTILTASLIGVASLLLTKSISLEDIYHKINWQIIFLLAGMIPLGIAMNNSGTDLWISEKLLALLSDQSPTIILAIIFGFTMLMSGTISNNATAIIMTPIAISVAMGLDLPLKPFILAVMFAANFSFFTPVGYQTNALIYGTGIYSFKHFLIIGGILSILLWIAATLLLSTLLT
ncbi:SLC13 family permease [Jejudonia soesokkakensis]|uniref:SLC13 family permease n=1 Tax=Jejudonia soesokkakensis TaxID=1323432 RepID=A0ABW2MW90_9FLAO